ncbi:hypothetical protein P692DRAFT_20225255 [Suillus brevipes Sb2]|nr:hypothetical protein P692DRAFT_20225255 [Suillus brevipes Sb2]
MAWGILKVAASSQLRMYSICPKKLLSFFMLSIYLCITLHMGLGIIDYQSLMPHRIFFFFLIPIYV